MSDRLRRSQSCYDLNYAVLHNTGEKVYKSANMDIDRLKVKEKQVRNDLSESLRLYYLQDLNTVDDVLEGLENVTEIGKNYRYVHIELETAMGETEYRKAYPKAEEFTDKVRQFQASAKSKSRLLKQQESDNNAARIAAERQEIELKLKKASLEVEEQVFRGKLEDEIGNFNLDEVDEIKQSCKRFENLLDECYSLLSKTKAVFSDEFDDKYKQNFEESISKIREQIKLGMSKISELASKERDSLVAEKAKDAKLANDKFLAEQTSHAEILTNEIELRSQTLIAKCQCSTLQSLNDFELLDRSKSMINLDVEMREIFAIFTKISKIVATLGPGKDVLLSKPRRLQDKALKTRNTYMQELHGLISDRDISEEKLKKSNDLSIEIPKFRGYDSKLDIYTFRSEFEKLIQPSVQKQYWVDILKKNYLSGPAATLVDKCETIEEVWDKLISAYGNVKLLLQNKLGHLDRFERLDKIKGDEKLVHALTKIINVMTELTALAQKYDLEYKLYVGGGLEKILSLLGNDRERRFVKSSLEASASSSVKPPSHGGTSSELCTEKTEWEHLKIFLEKERSMRERMTLLQKSKESLGMDSTKNHPPAGGKQAEKKLSGSVNTGSIELLCHICGQSDHVVTTHLGKKCIEYFACKKFVEQSPKDRRAELMKRKFCTQCLRPGIKHADKHWCFKSYVCPDPSHASHPKGLHVLLCEAHKTSAANIALLEEYKEKIISKRSKDFEDFTKNISLMCVTVSLPSVSVERGLSNVIPDIQFSAIFMLQTIKVGDVSLRLFFDTGCGDIVVKKSAMESLKRLGRARLEVPGPISMSGVGDFKSSSSYGIYSVCLPLKGGENAVFSGVCMDKVTMEFPTYDLTEVEDDINRQCSNPLSTSLPKLPKEVGGDTDILIGAKYFYTHPREVWRSKTGLSVFDSSFVGADGTTGIVYGPHKSFSDTENEFRKKNPSHLATKSYLAPSVIEYREAYCDMTGQTALGNIADSTDLLCGTKQMNILDSLTGGGTLLARKSPKCVKVFDEIETAGTEVTFRCPDCRGCEKCKKSKRVDAISNQEEIEQEIIDRNVVVDIEKCITSHFLPFVADPDLRIDSAAQERLARHIYLGMIKKLDSKPAEKDAIIKSEAKLHDLGYVDFLDQLPKATQDFILNNVKYVIPWRAVFNQHSVSTPCRLVFDASASPLGKCSLNSLLAKGTNNLNSLVMIMIRWLCSTHAFHTDISKMYNTVWLDKAHWRYQLYFWEDELKLGVAPRLKVIKTAIYGVRSSGNVAESGIRKTAELTKTQYPRAYDVMLEDLYVDDCMSGASSQKERSQITEELSGALAKGGFKLKGFTFSGLDPPDHLANEDKESVNVGGYKWYSKGDVFSIAVPELNLGKKKRGKKSQDTEGVIPDKLTMNNCVGVSYEIFDPAGRVAPLMCGFKSDISELHARKLDWGDVLPDNLRQVWVSNIEMIQEIRDIRYQRAVIPQDAVDLNCETIDTADASQTMICVAIYIRFRLKSGGHSCQLLFARTKTVPKDMTQPRAELLAASLNASTGHIVKTALGDRHKKCLKLTDSQVVLFWINSYRAKLKMWVRNQCIHIKRLAPKELWRYIKSQDMIADIGTRKGAKIEDVGPDSPWINGFAWMRGPETDFPMLSPSEIILGGDSKQEMLKECIEAESIKEKVCHSVICTSRLSLVPEAVGDRYKFSNYVLDPNKFRFRKSIRVFGLVLLFIKKLRKKTGKPEFMVTVSHAEYLPEGIIVRTEDKYLVTTGRDVDTRYICPKGLVIEFPFDLVTPALQYYFKIATQEIKHFLPEAKYKNLSQEKSGILYYTGRILPTQQVNGDLTMCDVCLDLAKSSFCVPIVDVLSPLAYSIASEIHWHHPDVMHGGLESILREANKVAFIIGGRGLFKSIKDNCARCRYLYKREVKIAMGPKHESNLCIAPAFYNVQVDICGHFESYSNVNKRAKVKIWLVIFCCSTTGATDIKVMEDYSTDSFILAFIRFACRYGYPSTLYPDAGGQLVKGCNDMILSFSTIKYKLEVEFGVQFHTCPVGSHYVHGKVERKIRDVRMSIQKHLQNQRLSIIQWETLGQQIANSINNMPIGLANKVAHLENLDLLTPNRLLLGRNNNRCPTAPLVLCNDIKKIVQSNEEIFKVWFKSWLISYVPTLVPQPKWFETSRNISVGDIVLISKSDKDFEHLYQYGIVSALHESKDNIVRFVDVSYQNHNENVKRVTKRGVRELVVIHPVDELGLSRELHDIASTCMGRVCLCNSSL